MAENWPWAILVRSVRVGDDSMWHKAGNVEFVQRLGAGGAG